MISCTQTLFTDVVLCCWDSTFVSEVNKKLWQTFIHHAYIYLCVCVWVWECVCVGVNFCHCWYHYLNVHTVSFHAFRVS